MDSREAAGTDVEVVGASVCTLWACWFVFTPTSLSFDLFRCLFLSLKEIHCDLSELTH